MAIDQSVTIKKIASNYDNDRNRLMDIALNVQDRLGYISEDSMETLSKILGIPLVEVRDMVSFYSFLSREKDGKSTVRLCNAVVERMHGMEQVREAFEKTLDTRFGTVTTDSMISLKYTSCIGMSDQAPSALINGIPVTNISPEDVPRIVRDIKKGERYTAEKLRSSHPSGQVHKNLMKEGSVIFSPMERGTAIRAAVNITPEEVISTITQSGLRGRGGAGFPTGMKWLFCRKAKGDSHYIICNGDEGEPGTFKDRVILTECPDLLFEGMTVAGYALGATQGFLYLRGEYAFLLGFLEQVLEGRRQLGLLGPNIVGKEGFEFDIRIQLGAGAYICGEESSLIESLEGKRGAPRHRPPFPVTSGYLGQPTSVNNVETLCCAARILEKGAEWFKVIGTKDSTGTKLLSVSGDCKHPGVYEVEFGTTIDAVLQMAGAVNAQAVQVGGPSGSCVAPIDFGRRISYEDIATGGSIIVFGPGRDLLSIVREFMEFFNEESCGWCTPCRAGTTIILKMIDKILQGKGSKKDIDELRSVANTIKKMSRCGLGQTAANPILTTLKNFRKLYSQKCASEEYIPPFDYQRAIAAGIEIAGREPVDEED
jgi:[NiFe] hydrogenase diaphorase moiety large subunit